MSHDQLPGWRTVTLGDLGKIVTGRTPPSSKPEMFGSEFPFITPSDMSFGLRRVTTERSISPIGSLALSRITLPPKSVVFVCIGATIGKACLTSMESFTNQQINSIVVDCDRHSPEFVYYLMLSMADKVKALAGGAATPIVNKSSFCAISVSIPPIEIQSKIAFILSAYDDLIENSTRRIEILEEMARRLYEEWFVQFRFQGHEGVEFKESEFGLIPEGWRIAPIKETYHNLFDGPHATPKKCASGPVFLGIKNIKSEGGLDLTALQHISDDDFPKWTKRVTPQEGDIVFSYEATLNRYAIIPKAFHGCLGRRLALIRPKSSFRSLLYLHFFSSGWREVVARNTLSGATVDRIPLSGFPDFPLLLPPESIARKFEEVSSPILKLIERLVAKSANLRAQRDLLLPKLISGEIDVSDVPMPT